MSASDLPPVTTARARTRSWGLRVTLTPLAALVVLSILLCLARFTGHRIRHSGPSLHHAAIRTGLRESAAAQSPLLLTDRFGDGTPTFCA